MKQFKMAAHKDIFETKLDDFSKIRKQLKQFGLAFFNILDHIGGNFR